MNKLYSHYKSLNRDIKVVGDPIPCCVELISLTSTVFDGKPVKSSEFIIDDCRTRNSGFKCSDFSLETQLEEGVNLKPAVVSMSVLPTADRVAFELTRFDEFVKSKSVSNN